MTQTIITEIQGFLKKQISDAVDKGYYKVIFDVHDVQSIDVDIIKLLLEAREICNDLTLSILLVGNDKIISECKSYEESRNWHFHKSVDEAKATPVEA